MKKLRKDLTIVTICGVLLGMVCSASLIDSLQVNVAVQGIGAMVILFLVIRMLRQQLAQKDELQHSLSLAQSKIAELEDEAHKMMLRKEAIMATIQGVDECVLSFGEDEIINFANQHCRDVFRLQSSEDLVGKPFHQLICFEDYIEFEDYWHQCQVTMEGEFLPGIEITAERKDGERFLVELVIRKVELEDIDLFVVTLKDITDRKAAEAHVQHLTTHDDLTGLPTSRVVNDRIALAIARASRYGTRAVVFFLDINDFKPINEKFGHPVGDTILRQIAQRLQGILREADTVVRYGGDEFVVIAEGIEDLNDVAGLKSKLCAVFANAFLVADQSITVGCSVGCAIYPEQASTPESLLAVADKQMYRHKNRLRNAPGLTIVS